MLIYVNLTFDLILTYLFHKVSKVAFGIVSMSFFCRFLRGNRNIVDSWKFSLHFIKYLMIGGLLGNYGIHYTQLIIRMFLRTFWISNFWKNRVVSKWRGVGI